MSETAAIRSKVQAPSLQTGISTTGGEIGFFATASKMHALAKGLIVFGVLVVAATVWGAIEFNASHLYQSDHLIVIVVGGGTTSVASIVLGIYLHRKDYWQDPRYMEKKQQKAKHVLGTRGAEALLKKQEAWQSRGALEPVKGSVIESAIEFEFEKAKRGSKELNIFIRKFGTAQNLATREIWPLIDTMLTVEPIVLFLDDETGSFKIAKRVDCNLLKELSQTAYMTLTGLKKDYDQAKLIYTNAVTRADTDLLIIEELVDPTQSQREQVAKRSAEAGAEFDRAKDAINRKWQTFLTTQDPKLDPLTGKPRAEKVSMAPSGAPSQKSSTDSESASKPPSPIDLSKEIEGVAAI